MAVLFSKQIFEDGCLIFKIEQARTASEQRDKVTEEQETTHKALQSNFIVG